MRLLGKLDIKTLGIRKLAIRSLEDLLGKLCLRTLEDLLGKLVVRSLIDVLELGATKDGVGPLEGLPGLVQRTRTESRVDTVQ